MSRTSAVIVDTPELPAAGPGRWSDLAPWWDRVTGPMRERLVAHMGAEQPEARIWAVQTEAVLREWAEERADRLLQLEPAERLDFVVSLRPILVSLEDERGVEAARLMQLRLGPWLRRRALGIAEGMRALDAKEAAQDAVSMLLVRVCRDPVRFQTLGQSQSQASLLALLRKALTNLLVDQLRKVRRFSEEIDAPVRHDETARRVVVDLGRVLVAWEAELSPIDQELYMLWMRQDDEDVRFWATLRVDRPDLCARKNTFYRRLEVLRGQMAITAERPACKSVRAIDLQELRDANGMSRLPMAA